MKTNVLKSSFAAFAFTLAIVASFAFSAPFAAQYYVNTIQNPDQCKIIPSDDRVNEFVCDTANLGPVCTTDVKVDEFNTLYGVEVYSQITPSTTCSLELREEQL